jgi:hypothetical protein
MFTTMSSSTAIVFLDIIHRLVFVWNVHRHKPLDHINELLYFSVEAESLIVRKHLWLFPIETDIWGYDRIKH